MIKHFDLVKTIYPISHSYKSKFYFITILFNLIIAKPFPKLNQKISQSIIFILTHKFPHLILIKSIIFPITFLSTIHFNPFKNSVHHYFITVSIINP